MSYVFVMDDRRYTLKEVAEVLSLAFREQSEEQCSRKIRHWTLMDLLTPYGSKHTGSGKSREYLMGEIRKAALLMEISKWRVPIPLLSETFFIVSETYEDGEEWRLAMEGTENVFLALTWNEEMVNWKMTAGKAELSLISHPDESIKLSDSYGMNLPSSAIVINVTRVFQSLGV